jgi:hypothetical protein
MMMDKLRFAMGSIQPGGLMFHDESRAAGAYSSECAVTPPATKERATGTLLRGDRGRLQRKENGMFKMLCVVWSWSPQLQ